jgi:hypothetical protein
MLIDLPFSEIVRKYKVSRAEPLQTDKAITDPRTRLDNVDLVPYKSEYPKSLINKEVKM